MVAGICIATIANFTVHQVIGDRPIEEETICSDRFTRVWVDRIDLVQGGIHAIQVVILVGNQRFGGRFTETIQEIGEE